MKTIFLVLFLISLFLSNASGQISNLSNWTWKKGDKTANGTLGVYGTQGVPAAANKPGGRSKSVSWSDNSVNLWLFGGAAGSYRYNDLWKYNTLTNEWTWVKGETTFNSGGEPGTQGVAAGTNNPGSRSGAVSWVDLSGNFWIFGGLGNIKAVNGFVVSGYLNDLWKYNPVTNQWTWMKGDRGANLASTYGTKGSPGVLNTPGGREGSVSWIDQAGNLWMFGGNGMLCPNGCGEYSFNDLWKYNIATNQWTWMKGGAHLTGPVYGTPGVGATANTPGGRSLSHAWRDASNNLWIYGGVGVDASPTFAHFLNDIWKYSISANQWIWMKGDSVLSGIGQPPVFGAQGVEASSNTPGSRVGGSILKDTSNNVWLLGSYRSNYYSDIWKLNQTTLNWTWVKGDTLINQAGVYGTQDLPAPGNKPGSRAFVAAWKDTASNFWVYGGTGYGQSLASSGELSDLWKLSLAVSVYTFTGNGDWNTASNWVNNLVGPNNVPPGIQVVINPSGQCTQTADITTQALGKVQVQPGKVLNLNGNLNNAGTIEGNGTLNLASGSSQLTSTGTLTTTLQLTSKKMVLNSNLDAGAIILTSKSRIELGNFNLQMDTFALTGNDSNFIVTNGSGKVSKTIGLTPVKLHIGTDSASYTPVTITNIGTSSDLSVRVATGTNHPSIGTTENVNRTWFIDTSTAGSKISVTMQWSQPDEQASFTRGNAYISQSHSCPAPPNCVDSYFDVQARTAATGTGPFTITRDNITSPTKFIIKSGPDSSTFTGNGAWNDPNNWTIGIVPPNIIPAGREILINHPPGGECLFTGDLTVKKGAKLTVLPGKRLRVTGRLIIEE